MLVGWRSSSFSALQRYVVRYSELELSRHTSNIILFSLLSTVEQATKLIWRVLSNYEHVSSGAVLVVICASVISVLHGSRREAAGPLCAVTWKLPVASDRHSVYQRTRKKIRPGVASR